MHPNTHLPIGERERERERDIIFKKKCTKSYIK